MNKRMFRLNYIFSALGLGKLCRIVHILIRFQNRQNASKFCTKFARNLRKDAQGKRSPQQTRYVTENHKTVENSTNSLRIHCIQLCGRRIQKIKNEFYKIVSPISSSQPIFDIQLLQVFFFSFSFYQGLFLLLCAIDGLISYYYLTASLYMYSRWFNILLLSNCFSIHVFSMV